MYLLPFVYTGECNKMLKVLKMKFDKLPHFISLDSLVKHNPDANRHKRKSLHHESRKKKNCIKKFGIEVHNRTKLY